MRCAQRHQCFARRVALQAGDAQKQVLGRNVLVLEVRSLFERLVQRLVEGGAQARLRGRTGNARQFVLDPVQIALQPLRRHTNLLKHRGNYALAVLKQRQQQVHRLHLGIAELRGVLLCQLNRLLRLHRKFVSAYRHEYLSGQWSVNSGQLRTNAHPPFLMLSTLRCELLFSVYG